MMCLTKRSIEADGLPVGMDAAEHCQFYAAGNAVVPQVAEWVALKVLESMEKYK